MMPRLPNLMPRTTFEQAKRQWMLLRYRCARCGRSSAEHELGGVAPDNRPCNFLSAAEELMERLACDPELRRHMRPWMLDFCGTSEPAWARQEREPNEDEAHAAMLISHDEVAVELLRWLHDKGFTVTDSGSGKGGWHMGVPCTDADAERLCRLVHGAWGNLLSLGFFTMRLRFWGWRFVLTADEQRELAAYVGHS